MGKMEGGKLNSILDKMDRLLPSWSMTALCIAALISLSMVMRATVIDIRHPAGPRYCDDDGCYVAAHR